jgi:hypothetical protein
LTATRYWTVTRAVADTLNVPVTLLCAKATI